MDHNNTFWGSTYCSSFVSHLLFGFIPWCSSFTISWFRPQNLCTFCSSAHPLLTFICVPPSHFLISDQIRLPRMDYLDHLIWWFPAREISLEHITWCIWNYLVLLFISLLYVSVLYPTPENIHSMRKGHLSFLIFFVSLVPRVTWEFHFIFCFIPPSPGLSLKPRYNGVCA